MRSVVFFQILLVVILSSAAWGQVTPEIPTLSASQVELLNAGEILVDSIEGEIPTGTAIGVIDALPAEVSALISDFNRHSEYFEDITLSELESTDGDYGIGRGITDTPWPMEDREWVLRMRTIETEVDGVPAYVSTWEYVPGSGNLVDTQGYYLCIPWGPEGAQTLMRYYITADLGTWLPDFVLEWSMENMLPGRIEGLRNHI